MIVPELQLRIILIMPVADVNDRNAHLPRAGKELFELRKNEMDAPAGKRAAFKNVVLKIDRDDGRTAHIRRGGKRRGIDILRQERLQEHLRALILFQYAVHLRLLADHGFLHFFSGCVEQRGDFRQGEFHFAEITDLLQTRDVRFRIHPVSGIGALRLRQKAAAFVESDSFHAQSGEGSRFFYRYHAARSFP